MNFGFSCSLLAQFVHNEWIESYDPTIEDSYRTHIQVDVSCVRCMETFISRLTSETRAVKSF